MRSEVKISMIKQRQMELELYTCFGGEACLSVTLAKSMLQAEE